MNHLFFQKKKSFILKGLGILLLLIYIIREAFGGGDLEYYRFVAERLLNLENIYIPVEEESPDSFKYMYGIIFTIILIPFTYINSFIVNILWLSLQALSLYRISIIISKLLPFQSFTKKQINLIKLFTFLLCVRFIQNNFGMLQSNLFLLYFSLEGLYQIREKNKNILGGSLIAFASTIKFLPLLLLPYLIYRKKIKSSIAFIISFISFFILVPVVIFGLEYTVILLETWVNQISLTMNNALLNVKEIGRTAHDLNAFLLTLLMDTEGCFTFTRNILSLDYEQAKVIVNIFRLILVVLTLFVLKSFPFSKERSKIDFFREISYILLITPLLFPIQQKYAFIHILPAIVYLLWYLVYFQKDISKQQQRKWIKIILIFALICFTISSDLFIGRYLSDITHYYKTITYGVLALIPGLLISRVKPNDVK